MTSIGDMFHVPHPEGYRAWTRDEINAFLNTRDKTMKMALLLGLFTGQRTGDVIRMTWGDYDGTAISVTQSKTKTALRVPCHADLKEALEDWFEYWERPRAGRCILLTDTGHPFKQDNFRHRFHKAVNAAGLEGLAVHGLRKTATVLLIQAGCNDREVMAITGHKTTSMVGLYAKELSQDQMAVSGILPMVPVQGREQGLIRALVAKAPVEAFHECVLLRFARSDDW